MTSTFVIVSASNAPVIVSASNDPEPVEGHA